MIRVEKFLVSALSATPNLVFDHMHRWEDQGWVFIDSDRGDGRYFSVTYRRPT